MDDSKTLYIYLETDFLGKGIMVESPSCYACSEDKKAHSLASKSQVEFKTYVMSLPDGFMKPPQAAFHYEPISKENRIDDASSKVRLMWKKSSRKVSKAGVNEKSRASQDYDSDSGSGMRAISTIKAPKSSDADSEERLLIDEGTLCWNLLIFFDIKRSEETIRFVQDKIQRTQSNMRIPSYIGEIICTNIYPGTLPPYIHSMKVLIPLDTNDVWAFEIHDFGYSGGLVLETETRVDDASDLDQLNQESNTDLLEGLEQFGKQLDLPEGKGDELEHKEGELGDEGLKGTKSNTAAVNTKSRRKSIVSSIARHVSQMMGFRCLFLLLSCVLVTTTTVVEGGEFEFYQPFLDCKRAIHCGNLKNLRYPFVESKLPSYCGYPGFQVKCREGNLTMMAGGNLFRIIDINWEMQLLTMAMIDTLEDTCPTTNMGNYSFGDAFSVSENTVAAKLLPSASCPHLPLDHGYMCNNDSNHGNSSSGIYSLSSSDSVLNKGCHSIVELLMLKKSAIDFLSNKISAAEALKSGFELSWGTLDMTTCSGCQISNGECGYNASLARFSCFCFDGRQESNCSYLLNEHKLDVSRGNNAKKRYIIGAVSAAVAFIILAGAIGIAVYCKRVKGSCSTTCNEVTTPAINGIIQFEYNDLREATDYFGQLVGSGANSNVHYGTLKDGREVAVKRMFGRKDEEFMNEVRLLSKLRHSNLVDLYGYCSNDDINMLVYEYLSNGTLADHLHGEGEQAKEFLPWSTRMNIAVEVAATLVYLHSQNVVHCDVKPDNILIDHNLSAKLGDFGISRLLPDNTTHVTTTAQGTYGYIAPECDGRGRCHTTKKRDVFSFGVVLMELISSKPASEGLDEYLSDTAMEMIDNGEIDEFVDQQLWDEAVTRRRKMIEEVAYLGYDCLENNSEDRPDMEVVLQRLRAIRDGNTEDGSTDTVATVTGSSIGSITEPARASI